MQKSREEPYISGIVQIFAKAMSLFLSLTLSFYKTNTTMKTPTPMVAKMRMKWQNYKTGNYCAFRRFPLNQRTSCACIDMHSTRNLASYRFTAFNLLVQSAEHHVCVKI